jgi:hypothetical protein
MRKQGEEYLLNQVFAVMGQEPEGKQVAKQGIAQFLKKTDHFGFRGGDQRRCLRGIRQREK